ncbi:MAG: phosphatase PAP2 family protein [Nitrospiria bacterium]
MPARFVPARWATILPLLPFFVVAGLLSAGLIGALTLLDPLFREAIVPWRSPELIAVMRWITRLGEGWLLGIVAVAVAAAGYWSGRRALVRTGWTGLVALIASGLATRVFKIGLGRPRPGLVDRGMLEWGPSLAAAQNSFPSGHATAAFALATVAAAAAPGWGIVFYALATLVAVSRVVLDAHFVADVVAGGLIGWAVARAAVAMARPRLDAGPKADTAHDA